MPLNRKTICALCTQIYALCTIICALTSCSPRPGSDAATSATAPELSPQIAGATLPPNIAAPAFEVKLPASAYHAEIGIEGEAPAIAIDSDSPGMRPPLDQWHDLLKDAAGKSISIKIATMDSDGRWTWHAPVTCPVADTPIDGYLAYRLLYPGYEGWNRLGIYQRDLASYEETPIIDNIDIGGQCVNCHNFAANDPERMMLHVRGGKGGTIIARDGKVEKVNPKCPALANGATYPASHPSGRYIAYSANDIRQAFHASGTKTIEVFDRSADLTVYDIENGEAITSPELSADEWMETFPAWTPAGDTLYFCRAKPYAQGIALDSIRYDLCRVAFDPATRRLGQPEVVIEASAQDKSVSFPRVSPDGRWLLYTLSDYGNFSIWHPESDLWLLDLQSGQSRPAHELNSPDVESYHSWSSDGRWAVFSSKRLDGLWARPYIAHFDPATGRFGLPFALPQEKPDFYDNFTLTYNIPELITAPVTYTRALVDAANK